MVLRVLLVFSILTFCAGSWAQHPDLPFLISHDAYQALPVEARIEYIKRFRQHMAQLEQDLSPTPPISQNHFYFSQVISASQAGEEFCLMGGVKRPFVGGKCSTFGNSCSEQRDGFKCGPIFSSACISRTPVNDISQRCFLAANEKGIPTPAEYNQIKLQAETDYKAFCEDTGRQVSAGCHNFILQMNQLNQKISVQPAQSKPVPAADVAPAAQVSRAEVLLAPIVKPREGWKLQNFVSDIQSMEQLKKLADQNDAQVDKWNRACEQSPQREISANGISIEFSDYIQHNFVSQMTPNEDGSWQVTLTLGAQSSVRTIRQRDGKFFYTDAFGKESPVQIRQIKSKDVNTIFPLGYSGSSSCFSYRDVSGSANPRPTPAIKRSRPGSSSSRVGGTN